MKQNALSAIFWPLFGPLFLDLRITRYVLSSCLGYVYNHITLHSCLALCLALLLCQLALSYFNLFSYLVKNLAFPSCLAFLPCHFAYPFMMPYYTIIFALMLCWKHYMIRLFEVKVEIIELYIWVRLSFERCIILLAFTVQSCRWLVLMFAPHKYNNCIASLVSS